MTSITIYGSGLYDSSKPAPGDYDYVFSPAKVSLDDALDIDANLSTGYAACVTLTSGQTNNDVDAGMYKLTTVGIGQL